MINKQLAQQLREQGLSYKEIAQQTGCSESWCKQNLKQISKNKQLVDVTKQVVNIAQSKEGVTNQQIVQLLRTVVPNSFSTKDKENEHKQVRKIKQTLSQTPNCVLRPYWLKASAAQESFKQLMLSAELLTNRLNEEIDLFIDLFDLDSSYRNSVRYALTNIMLESNNIGGLQNVIDRMEDVAIELEKRNSVLSDPHLNTYAEKDILFRLIRQESTFDDNNTTLDYFDDVPIDLFEE